MIDALVTLIHEAAGLPSFQAKVCVYYAIGTWRVKSFVQFPLLVPYGPSSTGKSSLLQVMSQICNVPGPDPLVDCDNITEAALRDRLNAAKDLTFLGEEADKAANLGRAEGLFRARYAKATAHLEVKRQTRKGWARSKLNIYGATVLHRREPFRDQATQNRAIMIRTRFRDGPFAEPEVLSGTAQALEDIAKKVNTRATIHLTQKIAERVLDTWYPLLVVAQHVGDEQWLRESEAIMKQADTEVRDGHAYEPETLILARVLELLFNEDTGEYQEQRIKVDSEIGAHLRRNSLPYLNAWQLSQSLKGLGLVVRRSGGVNWLEPTLDTLVAAAEKTGYEDDLLSQASKQLWF